jgi:Fe-S-cluster-containing dehydrogenase component
MRYGMVIDLNSCMGCGACMAACSIENRTPYWRGEYRTHVADVVKGKYPAVRRVFIPRLCMHCEDPPCVKVCPTKASYRTEEGIVLIDYDKCIGCKYCIIACPYDARYVYHHEDVEKSEEIHHDAPYHRVHIDKCTFCVHRLEKGKQPACVETCVGEARIFGDLDDPGSDVARLVSSGLAKPFKPEQGTRPKVYYIPLPGGLRDE